MLGTDARQISVHLRTECQTFKLAMLAETQGLPQPQPQPAQPPPAGKFPVVEMALDPSGRPAIGSDAPRHPSGASAHPAPASQAPVSAPLASAIQPPSISSPTLDTLPSQHRPPAHLPSSASPAVAHLRPLPSPASAPQARPPNPAPAARAVTGQAPVLPAHAAAGPAPLPSSASSSAAGAYAPASAGATSNAATRTSAQFAKASAENYLFFAQLFLPLLHTDTPVDRRVLFHVAPRMASIRDLHVRLVQAVDVLLNSNFAGPSSAHADRLKHVKQMAATDAADSIVGKKEENFRLKVRPLAAAPARRKLSLTTLPFYAHSTSSPCCSSTRCTSRRRDSTSCSGFRRRHQTSPARPTPSSSGSSSRPSRPSSSGIATGSRARSCRVRSWPPG